MLDIDQSVELVREMLTLMLILSAPVLMAGLAVGLVISILQAVTQIQEQTLTFVPKILGMTVVTIALSPWIAMKILEFAGRMFGGDMN